jgi:hypothetical protein
VRLRKGRCTAPLHETSRSLGIVRVVTRGINRCARYLPAALTCDRIGSTDVVGVATTDDRTGIPREAIRPQKALEASKVLQVLCARRAHKEGAVGSRRGAGSRSEAAGGLNFRSLCGELLLATTLECMLMTWIEMRISIHVSI